MSVVVIVPEVYEKLFDETVKARKFVALTGRSTGKTEAFARKVFQMCDVYKMSGLIIAYTEKYIKTGIWRTMKRIAKDIGVYGEYRWPESSPYRIIHKSGNWTIDLFGIQEDSQKIKGYESDGKEIIACWFEEFGSLPTQSSISDVEETIARSMHPDAVWLYSGNPPGEANTWSRVWVEQVRGLDNYVVFDTTFADIWHMLQDQNKDKITEMYLINREKWEHVYLGTPITKDGLVYSNFIPEKHLISINQKLDGMIIAWSIGVDVAIDRDKTAGVLSLKLDNGRIITRSVLVHDPKKDGVRLTIHQQADLLAKWYNEIMRGIIIGGEKTDISLLPHKVVVDTQDFGLSIELQNRGVPAIKVRNKSIIRDIERGKTLFNCNRLYLVEERTVPLVNELEQILWQKQAKTLNLRVDNYGIVTKQQFVIGEDDLENAWRYGHSWLMAGEYGTIVLPPLIEYDELKEIDIMNLAEKYNDRGVVYNVQ